jgi:hypothetical protein
VGNVRVRGQIQTLREILADANRGLVSRRRRGELLAKAEGLLAGLELAFRSGPDLRARVNGSDVPLDAIPDSVDPAEVSSTTSAQIGEMDLFGTTYRVDHRAILAHRPLADGQATFIFGEASPDALDVQALGAAITALFLSVYGGWSSAPKAAIPRFLQLTYEIMKRDHAVSGQYVSLIAGLVDANRETVTVAAAGTDKVLLWRSESQRLDQVSLEVGPAAGVAYPDDLGVPAYPALSIELAPHDLLLLVGDGFRASQRVCTHSLTRADLARTDSHRREAVIRDGRTEAVFTAATGRLVEEFGSHRIAAVLTAALRARSYDLHRFRNPVGQSGIRLDFHDVAPSPSSAVLSLAAAETLFRADDSGGGHDGGGPEPDGELDEFLRTVCPEYREHTGSLVGSLPVADLAALAIGLVRVAAPVDAPREDERITYRGRLQVGDEWVVVGESPRQVRSTAAPSPAASPRPSSARAPSARPAPGDRDAATELARRAERRRVKRRSRRADRSEKPAPRLVSEVLSADDIERLLKAISSGDMDVEQQPVTYTIRATVGSTSFLDVLALKQLVDAISIGDARTAKPILDSLEEKLRESEVASSAAERDSATEETSARTDAPARPWEPPELGR